MQKYIIDKIFKEKQKNDKKLEKVINYLLSRDFEQFLNNIEKIDNKNDKDILLAIYNLFIQNFKTTEDILALYLKNKEYRDNILLLFGFLNNERHAYPQTIAAFEKYLKNNPNELEVEIFVCELYIKIQEKQKAHNRLLKVLSSNNLNVEVASSLIKYFLHLKDLQNAMNTFNKLFILQIPSVKECSQLLDVFVKAGAFQISYELIELLFIRFDKDEEIKLKFANSLYNKKKYNEAIKIYSDIKKSENIKYAFRATANLALIYSNLDDLKTAKEYLNEISNQYSDDEDDYFTIALAYSNICEYELAIKYAEKSLDIKQKANTYALIGQCYYKANLFEKAKEANYKGLELEPFNVGLHWNQSLVYLSEGELKKGFFHYDLRIAPGNNFKTKLPLVNIDLYNGEDLENKSIFVYDEQGNGDVLAFIRMLPLLKQIAKVVVFYCRKELLPLFVSNKDFFKDIIFLDNTEKIPTSFKFDYQIPLMSLSNRLNITKENIPFTKGYLKASQEMISKWEKILKNISSKKLKVAFTWSGNPDFGFDNYRSIPTKLIKSLINNHNDIDFFAVTKGSVDESLENEFKDINIIRVAPYLDSFDDTAALLELCDLVISVDTAVAHLSLALGKHTWVLLYHFPFWVWGQDDKSIWYENAKIFKQKKALNWEEILIRVNNDLEDFKKERH